jgi:hypothetical protein
MEAVQQRRRLGIKEAKQKECCSFHRELFE